MKEQLGIIQEQVQFQSITKIVLDECRRLQRNKKMEGEVKESFETAPDFEEVPANLQRKVEKEMFFYEGPEVTTPADGFVFDY